MTIVPLVHPSAAPINTQSLQFRCNSARHISAIKPRLSPKLSTTSRQTGREVSQCLAQAEFESAFEQDQDERQHPENVNGAFERLGIDPVQNRSQRYADQQQHNDVGNARELGKPVGDEGQHQKRGRQTEDAHHFHGQVSTQGRWNQTSYTERDYPQLVFRVSESARSGRNAG